MYNIEDGWVLFIVSSVHVLICIRYVLRNSSDWPRRTAVVVMTARSRLVGKQLISTGKVQPWCAIHVTSLTLDTEFITDVALAECTAQSRRWSELTGSSAHFAASLVMLETCKELLSVGF